MKKARVNPENENAAATPRQIRWYSDLCLLPGASRPKRKEMDILIKRREAAAGAVAVSKLRKKRNVALELARALKRKSNGRGVGKSTVS